MKRFNTLLLAFLCIFTLTPSAQAVYIVDTGTPTTKPDYFLFNDIVENSQAQRLAGQFTTTEDHTITSIEGFMDVNDNPYEISTGLLHAVLYFDNSGSLDPVGEIFATTFIIPAGTHNDYAWRGVFGLDYYLSAGTYWVAFEARTDKSAFSNMWSGAPNPLAKYASDAGFGWTEGDYGLGFRISARDKITHTVPEPATFAIFGTGLLGAFVRRKFF